MKSILQYLKVNKFFTILSMSMATSIFAMGQCPSGPVSFTSQADVDNFLMTYPTCTELPSSLTINGLDITNLSGLSNITSIGTYLRITNIPGLTSLAGLNNLTDIGTYILIQNNGLTSLSGLENLESVGGSLGIISNASLTNVDALSSLTSIAGDLRLQSNPSLTSVMGLVNVAPSTIGGSLGLSIVSNIALAVCNLPNFCTYLQGSGPRTVSGNLAECVSEESILEVCEPLSMSTLNISAQVINNSVRINWTIFEAADIQSLHVERSDDAQQWSVVATMPAHQNGLYEYIDQAPVIGNNFYRVKKVSLQGQHEYSTVVTAYNSNNNKSFAYPNPTNEILNISGGRNYVIKNLLGGVVYQSTQKESMIDVSQWTPGVYLLQFENGHTEKIIKQ